MKVIIQRSLSSSVSVSNKVIGKIDKGYVILVGFTLGDDKQIVDQMINKIIPTTNRIPKFFKLGI